MFSLHILLSVALGAVCSACFSKTLRALSPEVVRYINDEAKSTRQPRQAGDNFNGQSSDDVLKRMGGLVMTRYMSSLPRKRHYVTWGSIPDTFDARTRWPECASIREIRDQGQCGSCWAIAVAAAITDRICIASNGAINPRISTQHLLTCDNYGCSGGDPYMAWQYYQRKGVVTGGDYATNLGCQPYSISPCKKGDGRNPCYWDYLRSTPKCQTECRPGYNVTYASDKYFAKSAYQLENSVEQIQADLMLHGPLTMTIVTYSDLLSYKSGVYRHITGDDVRGHVIKLIGWGVENDVPYWLMANSWNVTWGDKGFFKILRGANECGVEEHPQAAEPASGRQAAADGADNHDGEDDDISDSHDDDVHVMHVDNDAQEFVHYDVDGGDVDDTTV